MGFDFVLWQDQVALLVPWVRPLSRVEGGGLGLEHLLKQHAHTRTHVESCPAGKRKRGNEGKGYLRPAVG